MQIVLEGVCTEPFSWFYFSIFFIENSGIFNQVYMRFHFGKKLFLVQLTTAMALAKVRPKQFYMSFMYWFVKAGCWKRVKMFCFRCSVQVFVYGPKVIVGWSYLACLFLEDQKTQGIVIAVELEWCVWLRVAVYSLLMCLVTDKCWHSKVVLLLWCFQTGNHLSDGFILIIWEPFHFFSLFNFL